MEFGLGERCRDAEDAPTAVRADADRRQHGGITHHAALPRFFVAGVKEEIVDFAELPTAPGFEFFIEKLGGSADLGR